MPLFWRGHDEGTKSFAKSSSDDSIPNHTLYKKAPPLRLLLNSRSGTMEASGHARWFEWLLAELQIELWIGDAAEIRTKRVRKQKADRQDVQHILKLMLKD
jgi:hypothetical protein